MATKSTARNDGIRLMSADDADSSKKRIDASQYSSAHARHIALMDEFMDKVRAQEKMYVAAGFPADGLTDFIIKWFHAWEQRSLPLLRECMADDLVYADPTTGSRDWLATQAEIDLYALSFKLIPDVVFYPQDSTPRALPYYDFLDGFVRMAMPYRMVGRARFTLRSFDVVGVDRYNLVRDPERGWLIARIDTDSDLLGLIGQMLPIPIRYPEQPTVERLLRLAQKIWPGLHSPEVRPFVHEQQ